MGCQVRGCLPHLGKICTGYLHQEGLESINYGVIHKSKAESRLFTIFLIREQTDSLLRSKISLIGYSEINSWKNFSIVLG